MAAAGAHHLALLERPHSDWLAASYLSALLPDLDLEAALAVAALHSLAGRPRTATQFHRPPLQAPHHTTSLTALTGGGAGIIRPGALSLAHHGLVHIADAEEFPRQSIDAIIACLNDGRIVALRAGVAVTLPVRCQLLLARPSRHVHTSTPGSAN